MLVTSAAFRWSPTVALTALFDKEQLEESFVEAQRALAHGPADADAHHLVGKLLALQGGCRKRSHISKRL